MGATRSRPPTDRARIGWWLFVAVLAAVAGFVAYSFVGLIALGVFGYYATRPINRRIEAVFESDGIAAGATVLLVLLPLVVLVCYAGFQVFQQAQQLLDANAGAVPFGNVIGILSPEQQSAVVSVLREPRQFVNNPRQAIRTVFQAGLAVASAVFGTLLLVSLAVALAYFLLANDDGLETGFRRLVGGRETTAYAYAAAVDEDLESVFFGNFLFVLVMALIATAVYLATNAVAPTGLRVPMIFVLGFLTGVASLLPIVVGKIIYLPVVALLALQAAGRDGSQFVFVGGALVVYFLVLDLLPQTFLQPYITGRRLDVIVMMFAYLLGPVLFGWYGFFLLPILFVLLLEVVRIVLPELVHGEAVTPAVEMGDSVGTNPRAERDGVPDDAPGEESVDQGTDAEATEDGDPTGDGGSATGGK